MKPVLGHDDAKQRFAATLAHGRLASTYLFVGPAGVGKRTFAERLAAALLCGRGPTGALEPCGVCDGCQLLIAGTHPDLLRVAKPAGKTTLPVEVFLGPPDKRHRQGMCHDLALKPLIANRRVAIIDDADDLNVEAANCLLKTLEEPPPRSLLILLGTSLSRQLPTIRSRAQVIRFGPLDDRQVAAILQEVPHGVEPDEAQRLASLAGGSVPRALTLSEGSFEPAREALVACLSAERIDAARLAQVLENETKKVATEPRIRREAMRDLLGTAIRVFHGRLAAGASAGEPTDRHVERIEACLEAEEAIGRNANQSAVVQVLSQRLARLG